MTNLVLAPMPWQQDLWTGLMKRIQYDRLPHALLLHGSAGVGKGHIARLLGQFLLCEKPEQHLPCKKCHSCKLYSAGSHPDYFFASTTYGEDDFPDEDDGKTRKPRKVSAPSKQIKIDCIRDLIHFSTMAAHHGGRRIAIIEPAEFLNQNAANALLKTLEEPGEGLFMILVSHQPSRLLPTLRSRCQALLCQTPNHTESLEWLGHHIAAERAATGLAFCNGAPLKVLAAVHADQDLLYKEVVLTLESCRQHQITYLFAAESLAKHDAIMVLDWWMALVHRMVCEQALADWLLFHDQLSAARIRIQGTANPNVRMLFETLLINWIHLRR